MILERCPNGFKHEPHGRCPGRKRHKERSRDRTRVWFSRQQYRRRNGTWACAELVAGGVRCQGTVTDGSCPIHPSILDLATLQTMRLGQRVRYLRNLRGMTIQTLADVLGVSHSYIDKVECGVRNGDSLPFLCQVCDVLKISLEDLIAGYREVHGK